ncbi:uncharacterized protein EDB91DRAFT_678429 [Suillus paluster]|uniref:uncharacterized protein n=1 Tax=Suillus paluster TaxID=48578 RepID=UPI001B85C29D|nr:uncharacterized protein EDB91DRAFT_678429 [Suillus paluster]KAG1732233.1 hypothetical protein EDB91DRAFT_678429 [Suillus paluster]
MVLESFPYDIIRHIFSLLQQGGSLGTLSALACTSRSIHEIAVDALWENQQSLWPLILLSPLSLLETVPSLSNRSPIVPHWFTFFSRALHCSTWDRALHYGSRIRRICFSGISHTAYNTLLAERPSPLFPNIAHERESDILSRLQLFVEGSPGLRSLTVKYCPMGVPASVLGAALGCLTEKYSMLEQKSSENLGGCLAFKRRISVYVLTRTSLSRQFRRFLLGMTHILGGSGALKKLRLRTEFVGHATAVLEMIDSRSMQDLTLWVDGPVSVLAFYSIAELLSSNRSDRYQLNFIDIKNLKFIAQK